MEIDQDYRYAITMCPFCGQRFEWNGQEPNIFRLEEWSDGYQGWNTRKGWTPSPYEFFRNCTCNSLLLFFSDLPAYDEEAKKFTLPGRKSPFAQGPLPAPSASPIEYWFQPIKDPFYYYHILDANPELPQHHELEVRMCAWHAHNNYWRVPKVGKHESGRTRWNRLKCLLRRRLGFFRWLNPTFFRIRSLHRENMLKLVPLLDPKSLVETHPILIKAEAYRSCGKFAECLATLRELPDTIDLVNELRAKARKGDRKVFSVDTLIASWWEYEATVRPKSRPIQGQPLTSVAEMLRQAKAEQQKSGRSEESKSGDTK